MFSVCDACMATMSSSSQDDSGREFWSRIVNGFREGQFAEIWFKWMEWALITGAIYALAVGAENPWVRFVGWLSSIALMQHAIFRIESTARRLAWFVRPKQKVIRWIVVAFLAAASLCFLFLVAYTFQSAINKSGVLQ